MNWKYTLIVIILAVIVGGGILAYQYWWLPKEEAKISGTKLLEVKASEEVSPKETPEDETANWKTYRNEKYKLSVKYPPDWRIIDFQSETNMGTLDTFGFISLTLKNSYCDLEQEAAFLVQNYKTYNPFLGYEEYARTYTKVQSCSILIRIEDNSEKLSAKEYLKKVYLPITSDKPEMEKKINSLVIVKDGEIEQARNSYTFLKYLGGIDGSYTETGIEDGRRQTVINTRENIVFITNHFSRSANHQATESLFDEVVRSFQVLQ